MARVDVRIAREEDARHAAAAARLIRRAAKHADVAVRSAAMLREKILAGHAVVALAGDDLVGFQYFSVFQDGKWLSHSGLVVREDFQGRGLARRIKRRLLEASRRAFPGATIMSLTTSPAVEKMNRELGFRRVPLARLTRDPEFWKGCLTCRNYERVRAAGKRCCCFGMIRPPDAGAGREDA